MVPVTLKCELHPRYRAIRYPRMLKSGYQCPSCTAIWRLKYGFSVFTSDGVRIRGVRDNPAREYP